MPRFQPSPEQQAIIEAATSTKSNLLVSALAGAAKTTTLELIAEALPSRTQGLYLAFNKRNVDDVKGRLPRNFDCKTLNALGHSAWGSYIGNRLRLNKSKLYDLLKEELDLLDDNILQEELGPQIGQILRELRLAKSQGHVPDKCMRAYPKCRRLLDDDNLYSLLEEEPLPETFALILRVLTRSFELAMEGNIDFDDQVLMPTVMRAVFPPYNLTMVDEAQDLSALNHAMLERLVGRRRLIAVGDQCQAIYAFRGAYENGMDQMKERFSMETLTLSTSFRCPRSIVEHVKWRAPHMQAWDQSSEGQVLALKAWGFDNIPNGAAVICRNNAPLLSLGMQMLRQGRYPNIWGDDIAAGILKQLKDLGAKNMSRASALEAVAELHNRKAKVVRNQATLNDKMETLRIFIRDTETLGEAIKNAERVFNSDGKIHLMTGHKAKGHEFPTVFFLNEELVGDDGQDPNLRYVICTRAKQELIYINTAGCIDIETNQ